MFWTTHVSYKSKQQNDLQDSSIIKFRNMVHQHYDSLTAPKKIKNGAFDDEFLLANIKIIDHYINEDSIIILDLGIISGRANESNYGWMEYKLKKAALLGGANCILDLHTTYYDNSDDLWRLISGMNEEKWPAVKRVRCSGEAVFIKKKN